MPRVIYSLGIPSALSKQNYFLADSYNPLHLLVSKCDKIHFFKQTSSSAAGGHQELLTTGQIW